MSPRKSTREKGSSGHNGKRQFKSQRAYLIQQVFLCAAGYQQLIHNLDSGTGVVFINPKHKPAFSVEVSF